MTRRTTLLVLGSLLALSGQAGAEEPQVGFYVDFYNPPIAEATIWVDPDAQVEEISLSSADWGCGFEDPVETQPGVWVANGHPDSVEYCWTVHLSVSFGGGGGSDGLSHPFCKFVGLEKASFTGSSHTDSYAWEQGPYSPQSAGEEGHVCSNGSIKMSGNAAIHGDAHTGEYVKRSGNAHLTGYIETLDEPLAFAAVDASAAAAENDNESIPFSSQGKLPHQDGQFKLSGGDSVELAPGTYFFSKLHLSGGSTLRITGPTEIYVTDLKLSGGSIANESQDPSDLKIFVTGGTAKLSAHSALHAIIYGPDSKIEFTGGSDFFGTAVGRQLKASGQAGLHADGGSGGGGGEPVTVDRVFYNQAN